MNAVLTGWGSISSDRKTPSPNNLQAIVLVTMTNTNCARNQHVTNAGLCTAARVGRGACGVSAIYI